MFPWLGHALVAGASAAVAAFWPRYLALPFDRIDAHTHVHAAAMTAWLVLLIVQPFLVRFRLVDWHRTVGRVSFVLVPVVVVSSILLAHLRFRSMDEQSFGQEAPFVFLPLSQALLLAVSFGLAIRHRRTPALHARFVLGSTLTLLDPVVGRLLFIYAPPLPHPLLYQVITFGLADLVLAVLAIRDWRHRRAWWAFPLLLAIFVPLHLVWFAGWRSDTLVGVSDWFRRLPLP